MLDNTRIPCIVRQSSLTRTEHEMFAGNNISGLLENSTPGSEIIRPGYTRGTCGSNSTLEGLLTAPAHSVSAHHFTSTPSLARYHNGPHSRWYKSAVMCNVVLQRLGSKLDKNHQLHMKNAPFRSIPHSATTVQLRFASEIVGTIPRVVSMARASSRESMGPKLPGG
jgi:hypothetical protein